MLFEWDDNKNRRNIFKHSVGFETAVKVFNDPSRIEKYDVKHSIYEDRYITIGAIGESDYIIVLVYTQRDEFTRVISARRATAQERRVYNDSKKKH